MESRLQYILDRCLKDVKPTVSEATDLRTVTNVAYDYESNGCLDFDFLGHRLSVKANFRSTNTWGEEVAFDDHDVGMECVKHAPDLQIRELGGIMKVIGEYLDASVSTKGMPRRAYCARMTDLRSRTLS